MVSLHYSELTFGQLCGWLLSFIKSSFHQFYMKYKTSLLPVEGGVGGFSEVVATFMQQSG